MTKRVLKKHKAHTIYKNAAGKRVPGVTTITAQLGWGKQTLVNWANRMGLRGIDTLKYVDDKAKIGTLAHLLITDWLKEIKTDTSDYSKSQIDEAHESVDNFFQWEKENPIKPILVEEELISELYQYGSRIDIYGLVREESFELIDLKTGSGIYPEMLVQVGGGYRNALLENGYAVDKVRILNIPRSTKEGFVAKVMSPEMCRDCLKVFINCRKNHDLQKLIK